jgi:deoxycytidine triphosphate deaminase
MAMVDFTRFVDGIVHEPTQTDGVGLDLTVSAVYEVEAPGRVDFGGGELTEVELSAHATEKRNPDDDYEWWHLDGGQYLLEHNETLAVPEGTVVTVQTRRELRERGAFHPTVHTDDLGRLPLSVADGGIRIKENARVSTVVALQQR